jgi:hypothetical protein
MDTAEIQRGTPAYTSAWRFATQPAVVVDLIRDQPLNKMVTNHGRKEGTPEKRTTIER